MSHFEWGYGWITFYKIQMTKIQGFNWDLYFLLIEKAVLSGSIITDHKPWENQKMK